MSMRRRKRLDQAFGLIIRVASLLVLVSVVGVFAQMFTVARPLFTDRGMSAVAVIDSGDQPISRPHGMPGNIVEWDIVNHEEQRYWIGIDDAGILYRGTVPEAKDPASPPQPATESLSQFGRHVGAHPILSPGGNWLLLLRRSGDFHLYSLAQTPKSPVPVTGQIDAFSGVAKMPGSRSFLGWQRREISQWHWLFSREQRTPEIDNLRRRTFAASITKVAVAPAGRRVAIITSDNKLQIWQPTSDEIIAETVLSKPVQALHWSDAERLDATVDGHRQVWTIEDSTGAVTLKTLLTPIAYEGYSRPEHRWLPVSSSGGEQKFGLMPLLWGTMKAAIIALFFAVPVGIGAAIFVGFFLSPRSRNRLKPLLELLASFPSVVLGALTALLAAPYFIDWLAGLVGIAVSIPTGVLLGSVIWRGMTVSPAKRHILSWLPILLMPAVLGLAFLGFWLGQTLGTALPGGSFAHWLEVEHGIGVVHRNSMLVGIAMAIAIVPTVFSLAEDAIHSVPPTLAAGSLALGATHWQGYRDVVLPVAAPGIIAACMIGLGRAVGETMIVLLVSANTPLMEVNLLEGFRSVSATLALELSEAPYESVHYRVLFAAGLALFLLTFALNSLAELVRLRGHNNRQERR